MSVDFVKWNLRSTFARFCGVLARSPCRADSYSVSRCKRRTRAVLARKLLQAIMQSAGCPEGKYRTIQA